MSKTFWVVQQDEKQGCLGCHFLDPVEGDCPKVQYPDGTTGSLVCKLMNAVHGGSHQFLLEDQKQ